MNFDHKTRSLTILLLLVFITVCPHLTPAAQQVRQTRGERVALKPLDIPKAEHFADVGNRRLHSFVYGKGSPSIVLISGNRAPQEYWNSVVPALAEKTTVLTYDRAGIGRSETGDLPLHAKQSAEDLAHLLKLLEIPAPYIVVGHSYGGTVARLFAAMNPEDIAGLILEDCSHEDILEEQRKILKGADLEQLEKMVEMMSPEGPPQTETDCVRVSKQQLRDSPPLPAVPFVVITSGDRSKAMPPMFSAQGKSDLITLGLNLQKRLVALIPGGKHIVAEGVGHNIHVERPELLLEPIIEMLEEKRRP